MLSTENPSPCCPQTSQPRSNYSSRNSTTDDQRVDPCDSRLDHQTPLPKFTIRDFVFKARAEDITNHWPFSWENLQLCLEHGVSDVLPPFEALDRIRSSLAAESTDERICDGFGDRLLCESIDNVGKKVGLDVENRVCYKAGRDSPDVVKKNGLIVKLCEEGEPKLSKELSVDVEIMVSKVCPVCKAFSSPSNTTLNAHIDRCLSGESATKWTVNSKVVKSRIKQRKTRSMADVYATSMECTLEDLDRRNGTNWSSNLDFPAEEDTEMCADEKNNALSSDDRETDAVYFGSNGKKVRILSRFDDLQPKLISGKDDYLAGKVVETEKGSKPVLSMKKKRLFCRHKKERSSLPLEARDQMKSVDNGTIKPWVGSKRTIARKINQEHHSQHTNETINNLRVNCKRNILSPSKCNAAQSKRNRPSVHKRMDPPNAAESHLAYRSNKKDRSTSRDISGNGSLKMRGLDHAMLSEGNKKLPSLRKTILSIRRSSLPRSKATSRKKLFDFKKPDVLRDRANVLRDRYAVSKDMDAPPASDSCCIATNSSSGGNNPPGVSNVPDAMKAAEIRDEFVHDPTSRGEAFMAFDKSLESGFPGVDNTEGSQHYEKGYGEHCGEGLATSGTLGARVSDGEDLGSYFLDVEPIPIPGPPGSFLPSPGRTASEEIHGHSSSTTCRMHSSEDEHELVNIDSLGSPASSTSFASNSVAARSDSTSVVNLTEQLHDISEDRMDPLVESNADGKAKLDESCAFENVPPCRCFRKEAQSIVPNASIGNAMVLVPQNPEAKLTIFSDRESPSTSTSGLVLRLMGKNLMVVNKGEHWPPQTRPITQSGVVDDDPNLQPNIVSSRNAENEHHSFCHTLSRGSSIFANFQSSTARQYIDFRSTGSKIHDNFGMPPA